MSCCCINQWEHHLAIYHRRKCWKFPNEVPLPKSCGVMSCAPPKHRDALSWAPRGGNTVRLILLRDLVSSFGSLYNWSTRHNRNLLGSEFPCQKLDANEPGMATLRTGAKALFQVVVLVFNSSFRPKTSSGYNPLLFHMSCVTPGSAQLSTGVRWREVRKTTKDVPNEHHVPTTVLTKLLGRLSQHPHLSQSSWERALVFLQFSKPDITFLRQPHAQLLHEEQGSASLLWWRLVCFVWVFFSPFNFEDYRIYTYSGKIFCSTAMKEQSGGNNTHILWKLWHYNM